MAGRGLFLVTAYSLSRGDGTWSLASDGREALHPTVMAGLVPAIHVFLAAHPQDMDARHKAGHDGCEAVRFWHSPPPELRQRAILAQDWIAVRQRHLGNRRQRLAAIGRIVATPQVICAVWRIGANDEKVLAAG